MFTCFPSAKVRFTNKEKIREIPLTYDLLFLIAGERRVHSDQLAEAAHPGVRLARDAAFEKQ